MNLRRISLGSLFVIALLTRPAWAWADAPAPAPAAPADTTEAREHFADGLKLYKDGDFDAALVQFERAYAIKPNYKVLYNIAQAYFQLHEYVEARDNLARYLKDGAAGIDAERQASVNKDLADLEKRIAKLTLTVDVAGATVFVDGKTVGTTPLSEPISLSEGQRNISVEAPDRGARQRLIRVAGGEQQALNLDFGPAPQTLAPSPASLSPAPKQSWPPPAFWATAIGAVALGGGAGLSGYFALQTQDDNQRQRKEFGVSQATLDRSNSRAKALALTSDILSGTAIACAGVAVVILVSTPRHADATQVGLRVGPGSAALVGRF